LIRVLIFCRFFNNNEDFIREDNLVSSIHRKTFSVVHLSDRKVLDMTRNCNRW